jgi:hypothetical protein
MYQFPFWPRNDVKLFKYIYQYRPSNSTSLSFHLFTFSIKSGILTGYCYNVLTHVWRRSSLNTSKLRFFTMHPDTQKTFFYFRVPSFHPLVLLILVVLMRSWILNNNGMILKQILLNNIKISVFTSQKTHSTSLHCSKYHPCLGKHPLFTVAINSHSDLFHLLTVSVEVWCCTWSHSLQNTHAHTHRYTPTVRHTHTHAHTDTHKHTHRHTHRKTQTHINTR